MISEIMRLTEKIWRGLTADIRMDPTFILCGVMRSGTTSFFNYLSQHPQIIPPIYKEIFFFDKFFQKSMRWYKAHFPLKWRAENRDFISGEATPYYIFHPLAMKRIQSIYPDIKLFILLRDPVDRAFSHYNLSIKNGHENREFIESIENEIQVIERENQKILETPGYYSYVHQRHSYLSRGLYYDQLVNVYDLFDKNQVKVLIAEEMYEDPESVFFDALNFLELPLIELEEYQVYNKTTYTGRDIEIENKLIDFYSESNTKLEKLLGMTLPWKKQG